MKKIRILLLILSIFSFVLVIHIFAANSDDLTQYVDEFIGTGGSPHGGGNVYPGAVYPEGMIEWNPNTTTDPGGYRYNQSSIYGFSLTNFSGRGCSAYQDFPFMPTIGPITKSPVNTSTYASGYSHGSPNEDASPGFYHVKLSNNIDVALTVTQRTGIGKFVYPSSKNAVMIANVGGSAKPTTSNTGVTIVGNNTITGHVSSGNFCGNNQYTVYFAATFDHPFSSIGTWNGSSIHNGSTSENGSQTGGFVTFNTTTNQTVIMRVGLSFVSVANAQDNLAKENTGKDFSTLQQQVHDAWNQKLHKIELTDGSTDDRKKFYTAFYHTFFHPNIFSDANGQYMGFDNTVHSTNGRIQYHNFAGWDNYRSLIALKAMLEPLEVSDMMQSLVNDAQQGGGGLPRWEQANDNSGGMIGDSQDAAIATSYAFGARKFDTQGALTAMDKGASQPGTKSGKDAVREGLSDYLKKGYVTSNTSGGSASITLEYSIDDYALAQYAKALGDTNKYNTYNAHSGNWKNLFNSSNGYIVPKDGNGKFISGFSATSETDFREGDSSQYTWMIPHDLSTLFGKMGGNSKAISRLDTHFSKLNEGSTSQYAFLGNEPEFFAPWEYDFAGTPYKTQALLRRVQNEIYNTSSTGIPGNDDGGAMSSWYIWSTIGVYPELPGVAGFVTGSPAFSQIILHLENGHDITIVGQNAANGNPYVQSLTVNGQNHDNPWLSFKDLVNGATVQFVLGSGANQNWGKTISVDTTPPGDVGPLSTPTPPVTTPVPTTTVAPSNSPQPSDTPVPTPTIPPNPSVSVRLEGIDANNNINVKHLQRKIILYFFQTNNFSQHPFKTISTNVTYTGESTTTILPNIFVSDQMTFSDIPTGDYYILVKSPEGSLRELLNPQKIHIISGQNNVLVDTTTTPVPLLRMGDINNDNVIDATDYGFIVDCFGVKQTSASCTGHSNISDTVKGLFVDLNDDGVVDGIDYNILVRHFGERGY